MTRKTAIAPVAAALFLMAGSVPASAGMVTFNFNTLGTGASGNASAIKAYMDTVLAGNATVSVSAGAQADKGYNGDGHVVGSGSSSISRTLGTTEGSSAALNHAGATSNIACGTTAGCSGTDLDTWIRNAPGVSSFSFDFSNNFIIDSVSFDYQIFPDGNCTSIPLGCGGNILPSGYYPSQPDFTFSADLTTVLHKYGTTPAPPDNESPSSSGPGTELAPQKGPINTGLLVLGMAGANVLTFADWPATIGIDNLVINYHTPPVGGAAAVPEPASLLLLGSGLIGVGVRARRRRQTAKIKIA